MNQVNTLDKMAGDVVIRHTCHCKRAAETPADDQAEEHVFTVDGKDFPWPISERGPIVARLTGDLFSIDVEIMLLGKPGYLPFSYVGYGGAPPYIPVIAGAEFPWILTADGCQLNFSHKMVPTLKLAFLARHVTGNMPIEDKRPDIRDRAIHCSGGELIAGTKEECPWCHDLLGGFSGLFAHIEQAHPEHVRKDECGKSYRVS